MKLFGKKKSKKNTPIDLYEAKHRALPDKSSGFTYGSSRRWYEQEWHASEWHEFGSFDFFKTKHGLRNRLSDSGYYRYDGWTANDERRLQNESEEEGPIGRHRLRELNQWPTDAQVLLADREPFSPGE